MEVLRRDTSPARVRAWNAAHAQSLAVLHAALGPRWLHLSVLAVHPSRRWHGYSERLIQTGLGWAHKLDVPVGVLANLLSVSACTQMGFQMLDRAVVGGSGGGGGGGGRNGNLDDDDRDEGGLDIETNGDGSGIRPMVLLRVKNAGEMRGVPQYLYP
jgi:GNAT superfamily N-acetyltransferase